VTEAYAHVAGHRAVGLKLTVGNVGPWILEVDFDEAPQLSGRVAVTIGNLELSGTVSAPNDGTFGGQRRSQIVAGAGGWGSRLPAKNYHNDARVKARNVAEDAAREVGETIGTFVPPAERVGIDYVRQEGPASQTLEDVLDGVAWWVDAAGVTHAGPRPEVPLDRALYDVLAYDPRERIVTLGVEDPSAVQIGSVLEERLDGPQVVREYELTVTSGELRVVAWCGGSEAQPGRLAGLMRSIARRATDQQLLGKYRYRVVRMAGQRVELQAVRKAAGLPDVQPVSMWPGIAGAHAKLAPGAEVLVEFIEGDRTMPIITHFVGADGVGFVPIELALCGGTQPVARQGDLVQCGGPGTQVVLVGAPGAVVTGVPYLISFGALGAPQAPLYGAVSTGSPKVRS
jgi:hypothetical protein